jgi:hypothetical protein
MTMMLSSFDPAAGAQAVGLSDDGAVEHDAAGLGDLGGKTAREAEQLG